MNTRSKAGRTSLARARKQLTPDELFFFEHAGWGYDPKKETAQAGRLRCAKDLARAEMIADQLDWYYEWEQDQDPDLSWMSEEEQAKEHEVLVCRLFDSKDRVLEAIGGVTDADRNYGRVIEAELALEALDHLNAMRVSAFVDPL
jgi:hypothetical protein